MTATRCVLSSAWGCSAGMLLWLAALAAPLEAAALAVRDGAVLRPADVARGRELLSQPDEFVQRASPFDRQARLKTDQAVSQEQWLEFAAAQVEAWSDEDVQTLAAACETLRAAWEPLPLPLPAEIWLIKTSGREEGRAAYTRGAAIVLTAQHLADRGGLPRLLAHELFHVASRHRPQLRAKLYRLVGFQPCQEITLPPDLAARRITNPDAPRLDTFIVLAHAGEQLRAVPVLFSRTQKYDPARGGEFFAYMQFRLLVVRGEGDQLAAELVAGRPRLLEPDQVPDFARQIGRNTGYIIHPEEILADNFALLVFPRPDLPTPELLARLRAALVEPR